MLRKSSTGKNVKKSLNLSGLYEYCNKSPFHKEQTKNSASSSELSQQNISRRMAERESATQGIPSNYKGGRPAPSSYMLWRGSERDKVGTSMLLAQGGMSQHNKYKGPPSKSTPSKAHAQSPHHSTIGPKRDEIYNTHEPQDSPYGTHTHIYIYIYAPAYYE